MPPTTDESAPITPQNLSFFGKIVYLKTWSKSVEKFVLWLPPWVTANRVTVFRAALVVPIWLALGARSWLWAIGLFAIATALDAVDGFISHVRRTHTALGAFLDPLADKVIICGTLFALPNRPLWLSVAAYLTLAGAAAITGMRILKIARGAKAGRPVSVRSMAATEAGKYKMHVETASVVCLLMGAAVGLAWLTVAGTVLLWAAFPLACLSFFSQLAE
ncbi:hypothetical protein A3C96_03575 [Candidatus Uhrbacteria bacterium RIFCSPHIGHO2_02_FULL_60_10]|uniref:CDP-diacylglycerol--glycerol-3-phosphate 3-phosphatidyltransferase n=1 Tax=Candidatus Uhrbacteria bacterium RIFCSPHIGHO2_02_FULL_60_10 TaxID=1802392 RepID=A0A1F7U8D2_9BACT|nr:MAG: hypothetical protein A3C96_03575 [Candidatus Uhrbacteria bacterium RIFCSPHIGHO2_02_FULL_60_10]